MLAALLEREAGLALPRGAKVIAPRGDQPLTRLPFASIAGQSGMPASVSLTASVVKIFDPRPAQQTLACGSRDRDIR